MKKVISILLIVIIGLTLTGCDLLGEQSGENEAPFIEGTDHIILSVDDEEPDWTDFITATDPEDGVIRITSSMFDASDVLFGVEGYYTVEVYVSDSDGKTSLFIIDVDIIDSRETTIELVGDSLLEIEVGSEYIELGAIAKYIDGNDTTYYTTGSVDTTVLGEYVIVYHVTNREVVVERTINVVDTQAPEISMELDVMYIELGGVFTDPMIEVSDNYYTEGFDITVTGSVDTLVVGEYVLKYQATDPSENTSEVIERNVIVIDGSIPFVHVKGDSIMTVEFGSEYTELGAEYITEMGIFEMGVFGDVVDTNSLGKYDILYVIMDSENIEQLGNREVYVVDTTKPEIILNGDSEVTLKYGAEYIELSALIVDNFNTDLEVIIDNSTFDLNSLGTYQIRYNVTDTNGNIADEVVRTIHVVDDEAPVVTIVGEESIQLQLNSDFTDEGIIVSDNFDELADIEIIIDGSVEVTTEGIYIITYKAIDSTGNESELLTRTIEVKDFIAEYTWELKTDDTYEVTGYIGSGTDIVIPGEVEGKAVTSIGYAAFSGLSLTSVIVPNSIIEIKDDAFAFNNINSFTFEENSSLISIGESVLYESGISELILPDGLVSIGYSAFVHNNITSLFIPSTVSTLGSFFIGDNPITELIVDENNPYFKSVDGVIFNTDMTILVLYPQANTRTTYNIPESVHTLGDWSMSSTNLSSINLHEGIVTIGRYAFIWNDFSEITIPASVEYIGTQAFDGVGIETLILNEGLIEMESWVFAHNNLSRIFIPASVEIIDINAFAEQSVELEIYVQAISKPSGWVDSWNIDMYSVVWGYTPTSSEYFTTIPNGEGLEITGYSDLGPKEVVIPYMIDGKAVTSIGVGAFNGSNLTSVVVPFSVVEIKDEAFAFNNINSFTFEKNSSLLSIGASGLYQSGISELILPKGIQTIGYSAFAHNNISSIFIPATVNALGTNFIGSNPILEFIVDENNPYFMSLDGVIFNKDMTVLIQYPQGNTRTSYDIPTSVETIREWSMSNTSLTDIELHEGIVRIEGWAFMFNKFSNVSIPSSVEFIGTQAFDGVGIETLILNEGLIEMESWVFANNSLLTITIPSSVVELGGLAFEQNPLSEVIIEGDKTRFNDQWLEFGFPESLKISIIDDSLLTTKFAVFGGEDSLNALRERYSDYIRTAYYTNWHDESRGTEYIIILDTNTANFTGLDNFESVFTKVESIKFYMYGDIKVIYIYEPIESELINTINNLREDLLYLDFSNAEKIKEPITSNVVDGVIYSFDDDYATAVGLDSSFVGDVLVIPSHVFGYPVTTIAEGFIAGNKIITAVTIPNTITVIEKEAFQDADSMITFTIEEDSQLLEIHDLAFSYNNMLTSLIIPKSVEFLGNELFASSNSLRTLEVDPANTHFVSIDNAIYNIDITTLLYYAPGIRTEFIVPNTVTSIADGAFYDCFITGVQLPNSLVSIGSEVFSGADSMEYIFIPIGVEYIGSNAFNRTGDLIIYVMNDSIPQNWHSNWYGDNTNLQIGIVIPSVKLTNIFAQKETISFEIEINDIYSIGVLTGIDLYQADILIESLTDLSVREFTGLISNTEYIIVVSYTYDFNDGSGEQIVTNNLDYLGISDLEGYLDNSVASTFYNGAFYGLFNENSISFSQAMALAESMGGHLVTINTEEEKLALDGILYGVCEFAWAGGIQDENGNWSWIGEEDFSYTNWGAGEPGFLGDDSIEINCNSSAWNDIPTSHTLQYYIVEFDQPTILTAKLNGQGTEEFPYVISTAEELKFIKEFPSAFFELTKDIDMSVIDWTIIESFSGNLNGNGYSLLNLTYNVTESNANYYAGFIKDNYGTISNINFIDAVFNIDVVYDIYAGIVTNNQATGIVSGMSVTMLADLTSYGSTYAGGIIAVNSGTIEKSESISDITIYTQNYAVAAGIVAHNLGTIYEVKTESILDVNSIIDEAKVGGVVGFFQVGELTNAYADVSILLISRGVVGGVSGYTESYPGAITIKNVYATGDITVQGGNVGGITGLLFAYYSHNIILENSFASIDITNLGDSTLGGSVGYVRLAEASVIMINNYIDISATALNGNGDSLTYSDLTYMGVQIIEPVLDYDFFTQTMKWSPDIWNLDNLDGNTLPRLSFE